MKICLVGPGIMSIPPDGWGAVEILIWDYFCELKKQGYDVTIINKMRERHSDQIHQNTKYCQELIYEINSGEYDFVHLHYDVLYHILPSIKCKKKALTSHYPYIDNFNRHRYDNFQYIFNFMVKDPNIYNFVLADKDIKILKKYSKNKDKIIKIKNGVNSSYFNFKSIPLKKEKTIYLGKIDSRKNQHLFQNIKNIDFVGPIHCNKFKVNTGIIYEII